MNRMKSFCPLLIFGLTVPIGAAIETRMTLPLDTRIDGSEVVLVGKLVAQREEGGFSLKDGRWDTLYVFGTIEPTEVLKGKSAKRLKVAFPSPKGPKSPWAGNFVVGQEGIWILYRRNDEDDFLSVTASSCFYPPESRKEIDSTLARMKKRKFGESVSNLALFAEPDELKIQNGNFVMISSGLANQGQENVSICLEPRRQQLRLVITDPDNATSESTFDDVQVAAREKRFTKIKPGAILRTSKLPFAVKVVGLHHGKVIYTNNGPSDSNESTRTWTGELHSASFSFTVVAK